jgi:PPOX class probable F420-dependent enzyme
VTFTITSIGTPGSDNAFKSGAGVEADSLDELDPIYRQLIDGPVTVTLATAASDGRIQLNAMWFEGSPDGRFVHINTVNGRAKDRQMRRSPSVSVQAINPANPYHWLTIYGTVDHIVEEADPDGGHLATESIDRLAELYLGQRPYPLRAEGEQRSLFVVRPTKIVTFGAP